MSKITVFNNLILLEASKLSYTVKDVAPSTENELFSTTGLVVWSGASDNTIFGDARVNWAFRALHDALHLKTGIGFDPLMEVELGRIQASKYTGLLADLVYCEVAEQAKHYLTTGVFVQDQVAFTLNYLKGIGYKI